MNNNHAYSFSLFYWIGIWDLSTTPTASTMRMATVHTVTSSVHSGPIDALSPKQQQQEPTRNFMWRFKMDSVAIIMMLAMPNSRRLTTGSTARVWKCKLRWSKVHSMLSIHFDLSNDSSSQTTYYCIPIWLKWWNLWSPLASLGSWRLWHCKSVSDTFLRRCIL